MLLDFLLVKLEVVRIWVCGGDNNSHVSRNMERKPLQPGFASYAIEYTMQLPVRVRVSTRE